MPSRRRSIPSQSIARDGTRPRRPVRSPDDRRWDRRGADRVRGAGHDGGGDGRQPAPGRASRSPAWNRTPGPRRRPRRARRHARPPAPAEVARARRTSSWSASRTRRTSRPSCSATTASRRGSRGRPRHRLLDDLARRHRDVRRSASASAASASSTRPVSGGSEGAKQRDPDDLRRRRARGRRAGAAGPRGDGQDDHPLRARRAAGRRSRPSTRSCSPAPTSAWRRAWSSR